MKVLFVASGNSSKFMIAPFIKSQGDSLIQQGVDLDYFRITEKGILGYIKNAVKLRKYLKNHKYEIIHAHYTLSGWTAVFSFTKIPIILSLMGDDAYGNFIGPNKITFKSRYLILLTYLIQPFVNKIICKSEHIRSFVINKKKSYTIPNGVNLNKINYYEKGFRKELGLDFEKKYVMFLGSKSDIRKNYILAQQAINKLAQEDIVLIAPYPINHDKVMQYLCSVDVLIVPSFMEGSPNVVKEAMACNCPAVATNVGDVKWLFGKEPGYYICDFEPEDVSEKINEALNFGKRTNGRERIVRLGLNSDSIAKKIIGVYKRILYK